MGRKFRCVGYKRKERLFTIGEVYEEDDNFTLSNDNGYRYEIIDGEKPVEWLSKWYTFEEVKEMSAKDYIKNGSMVKLTDGKYYIALIGGVYGEKGCLHDLVGNGWERIECLSDESVMQVFNVNGVAYGLYEMQKVANGVYSVSDYFYLVYEKQQPKEMTVAEIEAILGYPVKVVKES